MVYIAVGCMYVSTPGLGGSQNTKVTAQFQKVRFFLINPKLLFLFRVYISCWKLKMEGGGAIGMGCYCSMCDSEAGFPLCTTEQSKSESYGRNQRDYREGWSRLTVETDVNRRGLF